MFYMAIEINLYTALLPPLVNSYSYVTLLFIYSILFPLDKHNVLDELTFVNDPLIRLPKVNRFNPILLRLKFFL